MQYLDADSIGYLSLEGLTAGVKGGASKYCTSCYTGAYPVAFPRDEAAYLQLALKLSPESPPAEQPEPMVPLPLDDGSGHPEQRRRVLEKDPVTS